MPKQLIICEKPSVAADVARALGVPKAGDGFYESDGHVIGHAVGHLVEQVDPEQYDVKYKTWRFEDLPILPIYYYVNQGMLRSRVKGWHENLRDNHPYQFIYIDGPPAKSK